MFDGLGLRVLSQCFRMKVNKQIRSQEQLSYLRLRNLNVSFQTLRISNRT